MSDEKTAVSGGETRGGFSANELEQALQVAQRQLFANSLAIERASLAAAFGMQFGGERDIYKAAGYPREISFEGYYGKYLRQDIAQRIVDAKPNETWRRPPVVTDDPAHIDAIHAETDFERTPFEQAWLDITTAERMPDGIDTEAPSLLQKMLEADKLTGIGEYGCLLLGIRDDMTLENELKQVKGEDGNTKLLLYARPFHQNDAAIASLGVDTKSPRYGRPTSYNLKMSESSSVPVHWSRVIHIAEGADKAGVLGKPRMEAIYNLLEDMLKVTAGAGEAAWKLMYKGMIISAKEGYSPPDDGTATLDMMKDFVNGQLRVLELGGYDVRIEGGEIVDPSPLIKIIVALISAATGIPQRILLGSERGELASSTDETTWKELISSRQVNYAETVILRPTINRLVYAGVMPKPKDGRYYVIWPDLFAPTPAERVKMNLDRSTVIKNLSPAGAPDVFVDEDEVRELAMLPPRTTDVAANILDEEDADGE